MKAPNFTVVIPVYNGEGASLAALGSVLSQQLAEFELLLIDDGSTDGTCRCMQTVADSHVRIVKTRNHGVSAARNLGINQSRAEVVTFLGSDDLAYPDWLLEPDRLLADHSAGIAFCGIHALMPGVPFSHMLPGDHGPTFGQSPCLLAAGSYAIRRSLLDRVGGFDERLRYSEDWNWACG